MSALSPEQASALNEALQTLKANLLETIQQSESSAQTVTLDQQAFGRVSRVDALQQQSMAKASQKHSQQRLRRVLAALARVDTGDYGYCLDCDQPIGFSRLEVRPETAFCLNCQAKRESH